jgi:hypothetical protein
VNPAGPDQLYVKDEDEPPEAVEVSWILTPAQTGLFPVVLTVGATLVVETVMALVPVLVQLLASVTVTV